MVVHKEEIARVERRVQQIAKEMADRAAKELEKEKVTGRPMRPQPARRWIGKLWKSAQRSESNHWVSPGLW